MDYLGLVMIVAGLAAAGVAWAGATGMVRTDALPGRDIELAAGIVAGVLSVLNFFELLFDLDQLDERGGVVGAVLTVALTVTSLALFAGVVRRWTSPREVLTSGDRGTRLAYAGVGLVILGWLGNVTLGVWNFSAGVGVLTWVLLAGVVLRWASDPASKRLPVAGAWIAVVLAAIATLIGLSHLTGFLDRSSEFGALDWVFLLVAAGRRGTDVGGLDLDGVRADDGCPGAQHRHGRGRLIGRQGAAGDRRPWRSTLRRSRPARLWHASCRPRHRIVRPRSRP